MLWRPRSLRIRYTLRGLLVFITLFMLWGGYHTNRSWKERAAASILTRHGASMASDFKRPSAGWGGDIAFIYQKFSQFVWREPIITHVQMTSTLEPEVVDALTNLPHLKALSIHPVRLSSEENQRRYRQGNFEPEITTPDGAISEILAHHELVDLTLGVFVLSDDDCLAISQHETLENLNVFGSRLSEEGLAEVVTLPRLRSLTIAFCDVRGDALASVPGSNSLEMIDCSRASVGREFAAFVGRSPCVVDLRLFNPGIDDDFIEALGAHPSLKSLSLATTRVTERCIRVLMRMPSLEFVQLPPSVAESAAADSSRKAAPKLVIE